jgi:carbamoyltransferase
MGLAPYGQPHFLSQMREIVELQDDGSFKLNLKYFRHHKEKIAYQWSDGSPCVGRLFSPELEGLLGTSRSKAEDLTQRHMDIARSIQDMFEEALFHLLDTLYSRHHLKTLALAGGCAMNSVANGKVARRSHFRQLYVQSAAGDAGGAIGAAIYVWHQQGESKVRTDPKPQILAGDEISRPYVMDHAYLGPDADDAAIATLIRDEEAGLAEKSCLVEHFDDEETLCLRTAEAIESGKVVGWFQGRMEWGPRSLGNRSILCDPRRADMKDVLNSKIKRRESFRPFAPSIQREYVGEWFEEDGDVPFMMQVYQIKEEQRAQIPAVTHVDGSGRLQTVYRQTNPRYWRLIEAFRNLTGVPIVLNTSFNENEPVVCRPEEALNCFQRTNMDLLVLGDWLVSRSPRANIKN